MRNMKFWRTALVATLVLTVMLNVTGGTIAWFTDTVTSGENKIQAGNLDVDLFMYDGTQYVEIIEAKEPIFGKAGSTTANGNNADTLWEPGKTQVAYLKLVNNGNLALKYQVSLNVVDGTTPLSGAMLYAITPDAQNGSVTEWNAANAQKVAAGVQTVSGEVSMAAEAEHYFALSIHMDEAAGNQYQGGSVTFDIIVNATQDDVEADSFGTDYDKNAEFPGIEVETVEELKNAIAAGETAKLVNDLTINSLTFEADAKIDLAGNDLVIAKGASLQTTSGELNIVNNSEEPASITLANGSSTIKANGANAVINIENVEITTGAGVSNRIQVMNGATVNMYEGKLVSTGKPCVNLESGTFNMYGGEIVVPSTCTSGGIVCKNVGTTTINLYGGKITVASGATGINTYQLDHLYIAEDFVFALESETAYSLSIMNIAAPEMTGVTPDNINRN